MTLSINFLKLVPTKVLLYYC